MAFRAGHIPWNAGTKGIMKRNRGSFKKGHKVGARFKKGYIPPTAFKNGHVSWRRKPLGTEQWQNGYLKIKVGLPGLWKYKHRLIYEQKKGPLGKGAIIIFKDGNPRNFKISNLKKISRQQLMAKNSIHNYPKAVKEVTQLRGVLNRQINKNERQTKKRPN